MDNEKKETLPIASTEATTKSTSKTYKPSKLERTVNKLKHLGSYKNLSEGDIRDAAKALVEAKEVEEEMEINQLFTDSEEKKQAQTLLRKYLRDYSIETVSDRNTLKDLIYLEVLNSRLQQSINKSFNVEEGKTVVPPKEMIRVIHANIEQVTTLKEKLGITRQKEQDKHKDPLAYIYLLQKKRKKWLEENQASRYMSCPHCGKSTLLKIKMDVWEAQKHPWFKDRILGNDELIKSYKETLVALDKLKDAGVKFRLEDDYLVIEGVKFPLLLKQRLARVFEVSHDYIVWLLDKWFSPNTETKEIIKL